MNIVITVPGVKHGGGLSQYIYILANELVKAGSNVHVVTTHSSDEDNGADAANFLDDVLVESSSSSNIIVRYAKTLYSIWRLQPDIIINNYNGVVQYLLPFLPLRSKLIHVIHGDTNDFFRIAAINAGRVASWIAPSQAVADHFNSYTDLKFENKVTVIPHGIPECQASGVKNESFPQLTYVGVLYEHKGAHMLPDIIKGLKSKDLDFHFNIVGDGLLRNQLEISLCNEIQQGLVQFTGVVSSTEVYDLLSKTSIFVYPTQLDSFGLVIAEAMMCGAVPVASLIEGVTDDIIDNGVDGFLVSKGVVGEMIEKIDFLLSNRSVINIMGDNAVKKARERFASGVMRDKYLMHLENI